MNPGIGPARAGDLHRLLKELAQAALELAGNGAARGLHLKAEKRRTVVFNGAANGTSYALTGWRFGTLRFSSRSSRSAHVVTSVRSGAT